jgi:hypothetical protein
MKTNTANILIILVMAIVLASCGNHSLKELDDLLGDSSSSRASSSSKKSSSSKTSSSSRASASSGVVEVNDSDIEPAASFASRAFDFVSFPFYITSGGNEYWFSMSGDEESTYGKWYDLNSIIQDNNNSQGGAFNSLIKRLYSNRTEFLNNGKFKRYMELLSGFVTRPTYVANGWDTMVRQLLAAYQDLSDNGKFGEIYEFMVRYNVYSIEYYPEILDFTMFVNGGYLDESFFIKQGNEVQYCCKVGELNRWAVVWAYSFWGRRYNEDPDSIDPIVDILRMLNDKYSR